MTVGYSVLLQSIAEGLDIRLNHRVERIECACRETPEVVTTRADDSGENRQTGGSDPSGLSRHRYLGPSISAADDPSIQSRMRMTQNTHGPPLPTHDLAVHSSSQEGGSHRGQVRYLASSDGGRKENGGKQASNSRRGQARYLKSVEGDNGVKVDINESRSESCEVCSRQSYNNAHGPSDPFRSNPTDGELVFPEESEGQWCSCTAQDRSGCDRNDCSEAGQQSRGSRRRVRVTTSNGGRIEADALIATIPIGVLRCVCQTLCTACSLCRWNPYFPDPFPSCHL